MNEKRVFISYSHDSEEHRERVLALSERLRQDGIKTLLDQYVNGSPQEGWPRWMLNQLDAADFVLVVCTETYYRRFRGHEAPGKGKGVDWEGALITQEIYDSRSRTLKFVPVFLSAAVEDSIPEPLRAGTHYELTTKNNYDRLYDFLLDQAGVEPHPVGTLKPKARRKGTAMTFDELPSSSDTPVDISHIIKYAPEELIGREAETKLLNDAWDQAVRGEQKRPHVLTFVALGGEGKTSLVAKWAAELAHRDWPGCNAVFAWSFYSQGTRDQAATSSDVFLKEALTFFGDAALAESATGAYDKGKRLAQLVGEQRALLIIDGLEPLQYAPTSPLPGELKDHGVAALLRGLAASSQGLCIVTTRYSIPDLRAYWETTAPEKKLPRLSLEAGVALLKKLGVTGNQQEFETLVEEVKGHALTLNLLGSFLRDAYAGDIRKRDLIQFAEADAEEQGGHAFHVMDAYVSWFESGGKTPQENKRGRQALSLLRVIGLFDRPASADCLESLWKNPVIAKLTEPLSGMSAEQRNIVFTRLEQAGLLTVNRDADGTLFSLDCHPLLREYFGDRLRKDQPKAWRAGHRRLYDHLRATTKEGDQPTLDEIQPLYQAVAHGCLAGMQQEVCDKVYQDRIQRGREIYSVRKLGAHGSDLGAIACFFETPWRRVSFSLIEADQAWLLNQAASCLRALGRLPEAREPLRSATDWAATEGDWKNAAIGASTQSELELTLGAVTGAIKDAEQSVTYADRCYDAFAKVYTRSNHADALHQAGCRAEAEALFRDAEQIQVGTQPDYPLIYSVRGFHYCDLLLSEAEREAGYSERKRQKEELLAVCRAIKQRATQTLKWLSDYDRDVLSPSLDHLTLGRTALYCAILEQADFRLPNSNLSHIDLALSGLRRAGQQQFIPLALLTRAWHSIAEATAHRKHGQQMRAADCEKRAQNDLDEAWEIAERGPMPLHMVDIHLYRARLFGRRKAEGGMMDYPWESPEKDLAEARRLIEKHGYWRRKEELVDAETAIL